MKMLIVTCICGCTMESDQRETTCPGCGQLHKITQMGTRGAEDTLIHVETGCTKSVLSAPETKEEEVDHPSRYGGEADPYEAIKVIEAWKLGFNLGNTVKYISRLGKKDEALQELKKAAWYLNREIENRERSK